ncbi:hypothetical protein BWQ96_02152 [Gracilariopsis chorda]|uniref:Uncharacterized protein n=1 Tax=Gracilariopsis chorda TaxID=448386 RepID=A0A2V3J499_9FLOR|nr:hypothetical protein BWQ96_02152 [Gracilariopsis chorda]|eukprot:PXF48200.1 hypothetical protein BWQ96_02152 [Gracilariopsis chorda]
MQEKELSSKKKPFSKKTKAVFVTAAFERFLLLTLFGHQVSLISHIILIAAVSLRITQKGRAEIDLHSKPEKVKGYFIRDDV